MPISIYGAFRTDTTMTDAMASYATNGSVFQISAYSQITFNEGADATVIDGDSSTNEQPNDPTQTYLGNAIDWDYTIQVNDGASTYTIGMMDWDTNGDGDFDYPTGEQGYFIAFIGGIPPLNTDLTFGPIVDNGASIPVDTIVPCFAAGTLIETPPGLRRIGDLKAGDRVTTLDHGTQIIRWIGSRSLDQVDLHAKPKLRPIRIEKGALGCGFPKRDLLVSPQHRMLVRSDIAIRMFDAEEILIPANKLVGLPGIDRAMDVERVVYVHMLFDRHEIVFAEGAPSESLYTGEQALKGVGNAARAEIFELFPELKTLDYIPVSARLIPNRGRDMKELVRRHLDDNAPLIRLV